MQNRMRLQSRTCNRSWQRRMPRVNCVLSARIASPLVLRYPVHAGELLVSIDGPPQKLRPGNGGLRIWRYHSDEDAIAEARILASGMTKKHEVFCTGFSGAKLVLSTPDPTAVDKQRLMAEVAGVLHELEGAVFTGCDVNTSQEDMELLTDLCPYVLASVGCPTDANVATGHGVFAAIKAWLDNDMGSAAGARVLVKGCGKVGTTVAQLLAAAGAQVLTYDVIPERADIIGCTNVTGVAGGAWWTIPCDVFAPCSTSRFITQDIAERLPCRAVVGSSNAPFDSAAAQVALEARGLTFIPEAISSAGAVLADSIECFDAEAYRAARPAVSYAFIRQLVYTKTQQLLAAGRARGVPPSHCLGNVTPDNAVTAPVGAGFSAWLTANTEEYDVVVVGAGMAGTSTAYQMSRLAPHQQGLLLESRQVAHPGGSSYGESRMYRQMYSDPYYATMQGEALQLWRQLEGEAGVQLLKEQGLLFYGDTDTGETVEGSVKGAAATMDQLGIPHTYYPTAQDLQQRWSHMTPEPQYEGVHEATAGSVNASLACQTMVQLAVAAGWKLREGAAVDDIIVKGPQQIEIVTSDGKVIRTKQMVLCAGAWTNQLLKHLGCELDLEVHSVAWGHWEVTPEAAQQLPQWFCFNTQAAGADEVNATHQDSSSSSSSSKLDGSQAASWDGGLYYAFPPESPEEHKIKVGIDFTPDAPGFKLRDMAAFSYQAHPQIAQLMEKFMVNNWEGVGPCLGLQASPYTMTRDQNFVLGQVPGHPGVLVFTGGSGRAFKFAPLIGRCLAELLLGLPPSFNISRLNPARPAAGFTSTTTGAASPAAGFTLGTTGPASPPDTAQGVAPTQPAPASPAGFDQGMGAISDAAVAEAIPQAAAAAAEAAYGRTTHGLYPREHELGLQGPAAATANPLSVPSRR